MWEWGRREGRKGGHEQEEERRRGKEEFEGTGWWRWVKDTEGEQGKRYLD